MSAVLKSPASERSELVWVRRRVAAPTFPELSVVALTADVETTRGQTMKAGTVGTVVMVLDGGAAYTVEFAEPVGALATVLPSQLRPA